MPRKKKEVIPEVEPQEEEIIEEIDIGHYKNKDAYNKAVVFWGTDILLDLKILDGRYKELEEQYELSGLSTQLLVKQLCLEELRLNKLRQEGGDGIEKSIKTIRDLMSDLDLTPKKKKAKVVTNFESLGAAIKIFERHKPFFSSDPLFDDVDGIEKIRDSMVGALQRTRQESSPYVNKFLENYSDYSVNLVRGAEDDDDG